MSLKVNGIDETGAETPIRVTSSGAMYANREGNKASYRVCCPDVTPAATATDIFTISGSATKTIRINYIQITADATAASVIDFYIYKRAAANTGGTATHPAIGKNDSLDADPTAVVTLYSANPSALGAGVLISADHYALPAAATTGYPGAPWFEEFGIRNDKSLILHNAAEMLAFSFNGQTIPAGCKVFITVAWTEE